MFLSQFQVTGRDLFSQGLVSSSSGNLSIRQGERIFITRRGCALSCMEEQDLIETGLHKNDRATPLASVELPVHRTIYQQTSASAIVHAHPPHATALSLTDTEIIPSDEEGIATLGTVPIVGRNQTVSLGALAEDIARALKESHIILVSGHGSFAIGQLLEEALSYTTILEASSQINCLLRSLQVPPRQE